MKIGVISDTHIPSRANKLPENIFKLFFGLDKILHAGDVEEMKVLDDLSGLAPVTAVAGNMDKGLLQLPYKREFVIAEYRIGLIHGASVPRNRIRESIRKEFSQVNIIIYGHTHEAFWGEENGVFFMNPGSTSNSSLYCSVGLLDISQHQIRGEIIPL